MDMLNMRNWLGQTLPCIGLQPLKFYVAGAAPDDPNLFRFTRFNGRRRSSRTLVATLFGPPAVTSARCQIESIVASWLIMKAAGSAERLILSRLSWSNFAQR